MSPGSRQSPVDELGRERLIAGLVRERALAQSAVAQLEHSVEQAVEARALATQLRAQLRASIQAELVAIAAARRSAHAAGARLVISVLHARIISLALRPTFVRWRGDGTPAWSTSSAGERHESIGSLGPDGDVLRASGVGGTQRATGAALGALAVVLGARAQVALDRTLSRWAHAAFAASAADDTAAMRDDDARDALRVAAAASRAELAAEYMRVARARALRAALHAAQGAEVSAALGAAIRTWWLAAAVAEMRSMLGEIGVELLEDGAGDDVPDAAAPDGLDGSPRASSPTPARGRVGRSPLRTILGISPRRAAPAARAAPAVPVALTAGGASAYSVRVLALSMAPLGMAADEGADACSGACSAYGRVGTLVGGDQTPPTAGQGGARPADGMTANSPGTGALAPDVASAYGGARECNGNDEPSIGALRHELENLRARTRGQPRRRRFDSARAGARARALALAVGGQRGQARQRRRRRRRRWRAAQGCALARARRGVAGARRGV